MVGSERGTERARLISVFWKEHGDFWHHCGLYNEDHLWITAADPSTQSHRWHQMYSLTRSTVLGKLACLVLSKILGTGTAECNFKQIKAAKKGQRANLGNDKAKKQVLIHGAHQQMKAQLSLKKLAAGGKLWEDDDFETCKMDAYCSEITDSLSTAGQVQPLRIVRCWVEGWEKKKVGPEGDSILEARLIRKYGGLQWTDPDPDEANVQYTRRTQHPDSMFFEKSTVIMGIM